MQQRRQERPVTRVEAHLLLAQLAFQHRDLMAQGKDLHILAPIAHRQQAQHRERVRHTQVHQSQQHDSPSCRIDHQVGPGPTPSNQANISDTPTPALTRADGISAGAGSTSINEPLNSASRRSPRRSRTNSAAGSWSCAAKAGGNTRRCRSRRSASTSATSPRSSLAGPPASPETYG